MKNNIKTINYATERFEQRLKRLRNEAGLKQKDIASAIGLDEKTYGKYEQGKSVPSVESVIVIAEVLKVSIDYLLCGITVESVYEQLAQLIHKCPENKRDYLLIMAKTFIEAVASDY